MRDVITRNWLVAYRDRYAKVIVSDARDVLFQADPSKQFGTSPDRIYSFTEYKTYRQDTVFNPPWIRNCYGDAFLDSIMQEHMTCSGILQYLDAFVDEMKRVAGCDLVGMDTAVHVRLIHVPLRNLSVIVDSATALITHAPTGGAPAC